MPGTPLLGSGGEWGTEPLALMEGALGAGRKVCGYNVMQRMGEQRREGGNGDQQRTSVYSVSWPVVATSVFVPLACSICSVWLCSRFCTIWWDLARSGLSLFACCWLEHFPLFSQCEGSELESIYARVKICQVWADTKGFALSSKFCNSERIWPLRLFGHQPVWSVLSSLGFLRIILKTY